ncbi:hypothetical protein SAMD00019534_044260 [Acytostelium subglobosum LB1]|uniref:hypothetical protein n=1 Tax=Acytostelium subglobosum LB1 TaxID=1410327 RepID=UPI000644F344|nr:hypothetical protein SAMD00019534_044260 [Acytostelium subglobosum LB1]GAM21251.1 hypothetical protein SAMD00019534_044260 [Acytostelium subglobosum LB1]|eukprot:XP_012755370.1 hypothetical protein SAMD00019534_044260 [Acytostelium subglobosum LB1]
MLPNTLKSLWIHSNFSSDVLPGSLPPSLTYLKCGFYYYGPLPSLVNNTSLTHLELGFGYGSPLPAFPDSLTTLTLSNMFDQPIKKVVFPPRLRCLIIPYLQQSRYIACAPPTLETLGMITQPSKADVKDYKEIWTNRLKSVIISPDDLFTPDKLIQSAADFLAIIDVQMD